MYFRTISSVILVFVFSLYAISIAKAQHEGHQMRAMKSDTSSHSMDSTMVMSHSFSRNLPMNRNGSGTSWMPDATPIYAYMKMTPKWNLMFHGSIFLRYTNQDITKKGSRGGQQFDAPNWFMGMAQRRIGKRGLFIFNAMLSLDRLTVGGSGYPLLFQSGESWNNVPLVDRQHPHDLFSELAIGYSHMINKDIDLYGYFGYPGEPSIGPPAFMHRISSMNNPDAPLGHHWQDATHITFGVATVGFRYKIFKLEGSSFTGREPDENRYNFDKMRFDSYSYRLSINPSKNFAFQVSNGFIKSPEKFAPAENVTRTTASVLYSGWFSKKSHISSAIVWGANTQETHSDHSVLVESNLQLNSSAIYGRYEFVQKQATELRVTQFDEHSKFNIQAITLGVSQVVLKKLNTNLSIGIQGSIFMTDQRLNPIYGKIPMSGELYLRLNPSLLKMR
jgi:hypothetical protein